MGPPFPQYNARPPPPGPNMSPTADMARSQSSPSERMLSPGYAQQPEPPFPSSPMTHRGPPEQRLSPLPQAGSPVGGGQPGGPPFPAFRQSPAGSPNGAYGPPTPVSAGSDGAPRSRSTEPVTPGGSLMPSAAFAEVRQRAISTFDPASGTSTPPEEVTDLTPPPSPSAEQDPAALSGPAEITAQMKCKVFLKRNHAQWKSIGPARLKLYHQQSTNVKQIVVESDGSSKTMLISTIVLTDGVERVGKTGVAIEISDQGRRTSVSMLALGVVAIADLLSLATFPPLQRRHLHDPAPQRAECRRPVRQPSRRNEPRPVIRLSAAANLSSLSSSSCPSWALEVALLSPPVNANFADPAVLRDPCRRPTPAVARACGSLSSLPQALVSRQAVGPSCFLPSVSLAPCNLMLPTRVASWATVA